MQKYKKIGFFLLPGQEAHHRVHSMKKYFKVFENKQNFIEDFPHVTLFSGFYKDYKSLNNTIETNINLIESLINYSYILNKNIIFENDVEKNFSTLVYGIENTEPIQKFQKELLKKLKPDYGSEFYNLKDEYIYDYEKYNYPFVGKKLIPHITITNIHNLNVNEKENFMNQKININEQFQNFVIGEITSNNLEILEKLW